MTEPALTGKAALYLWGHLDPAEQNQLAMALERVETNIHAAQRTMEDLEQSRLQGENRLRETLGLPPVEGSIKQPDGSHLSDAAPIGFGIALWALLYMACVALARRFTGQSKNAAGRPAAGEGL